MTWIRISVEKGRRSTGGLFNFGQHTLNQFSGLGRLDIDDDVSPLALHKSADRECGPRHMAGEDGEPDMDRLEGGDIFDNEADRERNDDLRDDRDVEGA